MASDSEIDPRYAAQFQRGFDPALHAPTPTPERRGPVRLEGGPPPAAPRVPGPPPLIDRLAAPAVAQALGAQALGAQAVAAPAPVAEVTADVADNDATPGVRSRVEWALLGAAALLLALAGWLFSRAIDFADDYQGPGPRIEEQIEVLAASTLPGPLLVAGVVALCLWIALRAAHPPRSSA